MILFKEKIKAEVNLEGFTAEEKREIVDRLEEIIIAKLNLVLLEALSEKDREAFYKLSEKPYTPAMPEFLRQRIPNASQLVDDTANDVIAEFNRLRE